MATQPGSARWPSGSLLGSLLPAEQVLLLGLGTQRTVDRNEMLLREADTGRDVLLLLRGCVKVLTTTAGGTVTMLAVRLPGDLLGELSAIDGQPRSATVVTATRSTLRVIGGAEFASHLEAHPVVATAVQRTITAKLRQATRFRTDTTGSSVLLRLGRVVAQLGATYGVPTGQGVLVDVHLTQTELAAPIGASEISIHRALGELRRLGLVATGYRQLLLRDVPGLRRMLDESDR